MEKKAEEANNLNFLIQDLGNYYNLDKEEMETFSNVYKVTHTGIDISDMVTLDKETKNKNW